MAGETVITLIGNLVTEPELRYTPSGAAVTKFRIASTPRTFDRQSNTWKDGETLFLSASVWRQPAENCAESLAKGMRVIVQGRLGQRSYETKDGDKRTVYEIDVDDIGPSLRNATAKVVRADRTAPSPQPGRQQAQQARQQPNNDPWANNSPQTTQTGWGSDEPPF